MGTRAPKLKCKPKEVTVGGLVFWPKVRPEHFFPSVYSWVEAGTPDNVYVYDSADTLSACRIPIIDATYYRGLFVRIPKLLKPKKKRVIFPTTLLVKITPVVVKDKAKGIKGANTKDHHRLNYGS